MLHIRLHLLLYLILTLCYETREAVTLHCSSSALHYTSTNAAPIIRSRQLLMPLLAVFCQLRSPKPYEVTSMHHHLDSVNYHEIGFPRFDGSQQNKASIKHGKENSPQRLVPIFILDTADTLNIMSLLIVFSLDKLRRPSTRNGYNSCTSTLSQT